MKFFFDIAEKKNGYDCVDDKLLLEEVLKDFLTSKVIT
jgi:hypothetical protein